ncbi:MAG: hypothetical protein A2Y62_00250 [Candidatus Fischerbacteria bacterium RBG_13_37_8]|uniref:Calcineurin-like phosphoesterase domain-containing protein n=1 Tax=Candidatus Fischerbacteria bacterium RBG_13_37_8 TaxID=1817863 RepID=A0A1F5VRH8_9BACT|nr:MAG: hypothetical protein A2Y62_00250 [Candidatus Fischerbacteria bacterium RBG_13_37_8]
MNNTFLVCSDLHIRQHEEKKISLLINLIETLPPSQELIIAGDLFDIFIGSLHLMPPWQKDLLNSFKNAKTARKKIIYVEGNRDFSISQLCNEYFHEVFPQNCYKYNGSLLILHGDKINSKDFLYLCWRAFIKNRFLFAVASRLPAAFIQKSAMWLEKNMKKINIKYKNNIPHSAIDQFINKLPPHVHAVISGHFHKYIELNLKDTKYFALPCWDEYPNIMKVDLDKHNFSFKLEKLI